MDIFHIVIDTSLLRRTPFGHPHFGRLLRRAQQGVAKLYIPVIALEERRTQLLDHYDQVVEAVTSKLGELKRGQLGMIVDGLFELDLHLPPRAEVDRHSSVILKEYLAENKIEVLPYTFEHAEKVWDRYFDKQPPFHTKEDREIRRKEIPDAWILEAALDIKKKAGRHCMLVRDGKLEAVLKESGFEIWDDMEKLDDEIEAKTAVVPILPTAPAAPAVPLDQLRSKEFEDLDRILLGMIEAWGTPDKETLFTKLAELGIRRDIAEHEARTLELSGALTDTGSHLIPTNRETARLAEKDPLVQNLLLKALDHGL